MIQRIQTVYLFLVAGLMAATLFLPPVIKIGVGGMEVFNWPWYAACGLSALMALVCIFLFKNRKRQLYVCYAILLILAFSYLTLFLDFWMPGSSEIDIKFQAPIVFPAFAMILDILAILAIRKDEKLVRSADRLR